LEECNTFDLTLTIFARFSTIIELRHVLLMFVVVFYVANLGNIKVLGFISYIITLVIFFSV